MIVGTIVSNSKILEFFCQVLVHLQQCNLAVSLKINIPELSSRIVLDLLQITRESGYCLHLSEIVSTFEGSF